VFLLYGSAGAGVLSPYKSASTNFCKLQTTHDIKIEILKHSLKASASKTVHKVAPSKFGVRVKISCRKGWK